MEKSNENKAGFQHGLDQVYATRTAEEYKNCLREVMLVCMTTEASCNSKASFFNKRRGKRPLSVAETRRLAKVFAKYGVSEWQGKGELRIEN